MLVSKSFLQKYVDVSDKTTLELCDALTSLGLEVEGSEKFASGTNLVIANVLKRDKHPDSEKLGVCEVEFGEGPVQVVCGAKNVAAGQKVIFAKVGAELPGGMKIKSTEIRGVESNGMICSLVELGVDSKYLSEESKTGIEVLSNDAPVGQEPLEYLGLDDDIIDIGLTPNRSDCYALPQLAIELGAFYKREVKTEVCNEVKFEEFNNRITNDKCNLFTMTIFSGYKNIEMPSELKWLLPKLGSSNNNAAADIGNITLFTTGMPTAMYDADLIDGITISANYEGDFVGIDEQTYRIVKGDIVIMSNDEVISLAGIMGSLKHSVTDATTNIAMEVANFDHVSIRTTANRLQLFTDSAIRYIKGREKSSVVNSISLATDFMINRIGAAKSVSETKKCGSVALLSTKISLDCKKINKILGTELDDEEIIDYLERFNFKVSKNIVTVPALRVDCEIIEDLAEEVGRIFGYDNIEAKFRKTKQTKVIISDQDRINKIARMALSSAGLYETVTYQLVSEATAKNFVYDKAELVKLDLPISSDRAVMRQSVIPSLLEVIKNNKARRQNNVNIFEISKVYSIEGETTELAIAITGELLVNKWENKTINSNFYALKGMVEGVFDQLGFGKTRYYFNRIPADDVNFHPGKAVQISVGKDVVGYFGAIHPVMEKAYKVSNVNAAFIDLGILSRLKVSKVKATSVNQFQASEKDFSFEVKRDVPVSDVIKAMKKGGSKLVSDISLFDVYTGEHIDESLKSVSIRVKFEDNTKTLEAIEIENATKAIIDEVEKIGGKQR